jgi:type IV pilus assembly protein PilA
MKTMQKGFTLIELMIVVAIIAILAAIALPAYQNYVGRAQLTEAMILADGQKTAVAEYWSSHGTFPPSQNSAGMPGPGSITGKYVASVTLTASTGVITALMNSTNVSTCVQGASIVLQPTQPTGDSSMVWHCSALNASAACVPTSCN